MSILIKKMIIINQQDYNTYDQIITALSVDKKYVFLAQGIRKSLSKNRANLLLGAISEIELFEARLNNKISKLKKANAEKSFNFLNSVNFVLSKIIFKYANKIENNPQSFFNAYLEVFDLFGAKQNTYILTYLLNKILDSFGIKPNYKSCVECQSQKKLVYFNFYQGGFLCDEHNDNKFLDQKTLWAFYWLDVSFEKYHKHCYDDINKKIFKLLLEYLNDNIF